MIHVQIHRRLLHDDAFGVGEALNETAYGKGLIARGIHYLTLTHKKSNEVQISQAYERFIQLKKLLPSWVFFSDASNMSFSTWQNSYTHIVIELNNCFLFEAFANLTLTSFYSIRCCLCHCRKTSICSHLNHGRMKQF